MKMQQGLHASTKTVSNHLGGINASQVKRVQRTGSVSLLYSHDLGFTRHVVEIFENGTYICHLNESPCFRRGTHEVMARLHGYDLTEMEGVMVARAASAAPHAQAADPGDLFAQPVLAASAQLEQGATGAVKEFRFLVVRKKSANGGRYDAGRLITVQMTQSEFDCLQSRTERVHAAIEQQLGLSLAESPAWSEQPLVPGGFEALLRDAIAASAEARFIAYYPDALRHRDYKRVVVNGMPYRYQSFSNDQIIKWAPEAVALMH
ncbi:hypothetical protein [Paraburkholderia youngii]|uniref:hypothetical protein n=1 Tax=Paraburkholderia youngii TaxID=2782701 RepID=UPI003D203503